MASSNNVEWKERILAELYKAHTAHPTGYRKLRLDDDEFPPEKVDPFFEDLVTRHLLKGNIEQRNVRLTPQGAEYVQDNFPQVADRID